MPHTDGTSTSVTSTDPSNASDPSAPTSEETESTKPKTRTFLRKWLSTYKWLRYDEEEKFMYCEICTSHNKFGTKMHKSKKCTNFQNSTLTHHVSNKEHDWCLKVPALQKDFQKSRVKVTSEQDKAALVLMKATHWMAQEGVPLSKFESLSSFLTEVCVPDLIPLQQKNITYSSRHTATEMLTSLAQSVDAALKQKAQASPFVTVLVDESTDITNHKRLVLYIQILDHTFEPSTHFVANKECVDGTGQGIAESVKELLEELEIPLNKVMSLGSDGAAVMTGRNKGCTGIMLRSNPHMVNVHCVAHSLALCTSQAADKISDLKDHQQILTDLFYYFRGSPKRAARIRSIQTLLDDPVLTYKELHSVRWLSYCNALQTVHRTIDSLLTYLTEVTRDVTKDPKAAGLKKKIGTEKFIGITTMMMDIMAPVTVLSQFFQTDNVDIALVKVKLEMAVEDLHKIKAMKSPCLTALADDLQNGKFKGHEITSSRASFSLDELCSKFVDKLVENIKSRFPDTSLLSSFGILSLRPLSFLSDEQLRVFGEDELDQLIAHYGEEAKHAWKEEGENQSANLPVLQSSMVMKLGRNGHSSKEL